MTETTRAILLTTLALAWLLFAAVLIGGEACSAVDAVKQEEIR